MKNIFLLVACFIISLHSIAQERFQSVVFTQLNNYPDAQHFLDKKMPAHNGNRTTSGTGAWYNNADSVLGFAGGSLYTSAFWPDTTVIFGYDNGGVPAAVGYGVPYSNSYYPISLAILFNPMDSAWVTNGSFIPPTSGYTIDSVNIVGVYGRPAGTLYTDSIKLSFVYGNGNTTTNLWMRPINNLWDSLLSPDTFIYSPLAFWDTLQNTIRNAPGVSIAPVTYTIPLGPGDTSVATPFTRSYPVNFVVPAGNFTAMSISFISGDPSFAEGDSILSVLGSFYHGAFLPAYTNVTPSGAWLYPPVAADTPGTVPLTDNFLPGYYKVGGSWDANSWSPYYIPSFLGPITDSVPTPAVYFHAYSSLSTKNPTVNNPLSQVKAYPNPAHDEITIAFSLPAPAPVSVSLTNVLGQEVSEQQMGVVTTGNAVMNISALPAGVYFYTVTANGQRNTGKVLVAH